MNLRSYNVCEVFIHALSLLSYSISQEFFYTDLSSLTYWN